MRTPERPSLWTRLFRRRDEGTVDDDAADLGTAFGLDFVLDQQPAPPGAARPRGEGETPWPWSPR
jgi:hypothetical protein